MHYLYFFGNSLYYFYLKHSITFSSSKVLILLKHLIPVILSIALKLISLIRRSMKLLAIYIIFYQRNNLYVQQRTQCILLRKKTVPNEYIFHHIIKKQQERRT